MLAAFDQENSDISLVKLEQERLNRLLKGKTAAKIAFSRKHSGVNGVKAEKNDITVSWLEKE